MPVQPTVIISAPSTAALSSTPIGPSAPPPNEEVTSTLPAAPTEKDTLSAEELRRLKPLPQQSTRVFCIREGLRYKTIVNLYCALESRNPAQSSYRTRLSEGQVINMARYAEFDLLRRIDRKVISRQMASAPSIILKEYSNGRQEMWRSHTYSSNFSTLISRHQRFVRERLRKNTRGTRSQSPLQIGAFVAVPRGRAGYRY